MRVGVRVRVAFCFVFFPPPAVPNVFVEVLWKTGHKRRRVVREADREGHHSFWDGIIVTNYLSIELIVTKYSFPGSADYPTRRVSVPAGRFVGYGDTFSC